MQSIGEISKQLLVPAVWTWGQILVLVENGAKITNRKDVETVQLNIRLILISKQRTIEQLHTPAVLNLRDTTCTTPKHRVLKMYRRFAKQRSHHSVFSISWKVGHLQVPACQSVNTGNMLITPKGSQNFLISDSATAILREKTGKLVWSLVNRLFGVNVTAIGISRPGYFMLQLLLLG